MKQFQKFSLFVLLWVMAFGAVAQNMELTFTGRDSYGNYVRLSQVDIQNQSQNWTETLTWPDTTLLLINVTDIVEPEASMFPFVGQNVPNPFDGITELAVNLTENGPLHLAVYNVAGMLISEYRGELTQGVHRFRISVVKPQACVVVARSGVRQGSVKILNNGHGSSNGVEYVGTSHFVQKGLSVQPFAYGDQMSYTGTATISGHSQQSATITQTQNGSETITLIFNALPIVETVQITNLTDATATCGGNVTNDGGATVTARGVCWSTGQNPTISGSHTTDGTGTGSFTSTITGLVANTTYYMCAYATNSVGTAYGNRVEFVTPAGIPTVTTSTVSNIESTSAICGGNVTNDGGATVTARGVCWSTSHNPTISGSHTTNGTGTGMFTSSLTGLIAGATYYVRAYATNNLGTAYGEEVSFSTFVVSDGMACPGAATVIDGSGNTYNTVWIGHQCWMKENLRTKKYANGTSISQGSSTSTTTAYWYYPNNSSSNMSTYGLLYNWPAVMGSSSSSSANPSGVQGICPTGWHVPSDAEWTQLTDYVSSQSQYVCGSDNTYIAKALASTTGWSSSTYTCAVGNTPSNNNATCFGALPAGGYYSSGYYYSGDFAGFWSATESSSSNASYRSLTYSGAPVDRGSNSKSVGYSVRCVRD